MNKLKDFSFVICTFLPLSGINLGFIDLYYYYIVIVIVFPLLLFKYKTIDQSIVLACIYLFFIGIFNVIGNNNDLFSFIKVFLSVLVFYWLFYLIIKGSDFDLKYLFKLYYKWSIVTAYIGIIQFFFFLIGFEYGYNYEWIGLRNIGLGELGGTAVYPVHSVLGEPAAFASVMAPAVYMALYTIWNKNSNIHTGSSLHAMVIITSYILTQSSTGYVTLLMAILLINLKRINFLKLSLGIIALPALVITLYSVSPKFQDRLDSSINLLTGKIIIDAVQNSDKANGSSLILFNHFIISKRNALDHPFGTGLGSHHIAFQRYNTLQSWFTGYGEGSIILNLHDANSLLNRILSELGIAGVIFTIIFMIKYFIRNDDSYYSLINQASLIVIFANLLRGGSYFIFGFPFFILCYYYSHKFYSEKFNTISYNLEK